MSIFPLLSTQLGIWFADQVAQSHNTYVIAHAVELEGDLDLVCLKRAIQMGMAEADTVNARFFADETGQWQQIDGRGADAVPEPEVVDCRAEANPQQAAWALMQFDCAGDLPAEGTAPLMRHVLLNISEGTTQRWLWYQRYHHIMLDGFSFTTLTRRVAELYSALLQNETPAPSPFRSVETVIADRQTYEASPRFAEDRAYWSEACADLPASVTLSLRPSATASGSVVSHSRPLKAATSVALHMLASERRISVFDLLTAGITAYLARLSGQNRQAVGVPFMRRMGFAGAASSAPVVNVLPLIVDVDPFAPIAALATSVKSAMSKARRHQRYDAEQIQRDLGLLGSGRALYGPVINYRMFDYDLRFGNISGKTHHLAVGPVDDIEFGLLITDSAITLEMRGNAGLYEVHDLQRHAERLEALLEGVVELAEAPVAQLPVMFPQEAEGLAHLSHGPSVANEPGYRTLLDALARNAEWMPHETALVFGAQTRSFARFAADTAQLARLLIARGIGPGDFVAVALPRCEEAVTTLFAVMASGATYMPIDPDYPAERIAAMCEDAAPRLAVTVGSEAGVLPGNLTTVRLDDPAIAAELATLDTTIIRDDERTAPLTGDTIAYVIFTSGSTGRPKGVMNTHAALLNLFLGHTPTIYRPAIEAVATRQGGRRLRAAHTHSFGFDSSWLQIFWMLHGQELHVIDEDLRRDADRLVESIRSREIDALDLPPSFCTQLINAGLFSSEQHQPSLVLIGGEAASPSLWTALRQQTSLQAHNLYGPTEFTVDALRCEPASCEQPAIGRPIGNARAYILDALLQPVPTGVVGELYLAGSGIARGYLGRPDLTAQRFVANPFEDGQPMYRTGDRVRWNNEGLVEFLGRTDHQVKVRGYRIETPEIEAALLALPSVEAALVVAQPIEGSHRLIAYCTLAERFDAVDGSNLREALRGTLPNYMVPAAIVMLDAFPLNVNGKIDRARLPEPSVTVAEQASTPQEIALCSAMAEVLKLPAVGLEHDFFALGGDSITAMTLCMALRARGFVLRPRDVFAQRTPMLMARALQPLEDTAAAPVKSVISPEETERLAARYGAIESVVPALATQKGMLFHSQLGDTAGNYNAFTRLDLEGPLDTHRLRRAFDAVLRRHPQLGATFETEAGDEALVAVPAITSNAHDLWPFDEHDLSDLTTTEQQAELERLQDHAVAREHLAPAFNRLIGATLIHLSADEHVLLIVVHHLMIDGWSTPILLRDLMQAYHRNGTALPALSVSYAQVVSQLAARDHAASREVWAQVLADAAPTRLFDAPNASVEEGEVRLSATVTAQLTAICRQRGITLNILMQAVWATLLGSMAGRSNVVFGTPVAGRSAPVAGLADQIGLFLNTIPVPLDLTPDTPLFDQAQALQDRHATLMEHDGLGLGEIQALAGGEALFDTLLVVENYPDNDYLGYDLDGLTVASVHNRGYSHYPLALLVLPGDELTLLVESRGAIANPAALAARVAAILEALASDETLAPASLPVWGEEDRQLVAKVNATTHPLPPLTLRDLLLAQAGRTPDAVALLDETVMLTFREARHQALHLAERLRAAGVKTGDTVAVALPRSARLSLALLGVIEAGAAFLPLDLSYPTDRLAFMLEDAAPTAIIADTSSAALAPSGMTVIRFDELSDPSQEVRDLSGDPALGPTSPAYVLYTSGTTGRPKGAVVSHGAIVNRILWMQDAYPLDATDTILQKTPCGFDVSVWEFFWSYLVGARLVMAPPDAHRDPAALVDLIEQHSVTTLHFVPSMLAIFLTTLSETGEAARCATLRRTFCSGEALPKTLSRDYAKLIGSELHNLYGPTEAAIDVTYAPAAAQNLQGSGSVPIGKPVWNTELRILDHLLRPVPVGVAGELYLCGVQLGLGYLARPDLTASRFVADPFAEGQRMYRTGDIARWLADGQVEYLGRTDHQIKIRGQRVELSEIEAQIEALPEIRQAVVLAVSPQTGNAVAGADDRRLVAYVVPQPDASIDADWLTASLKAELPQHMVPSVFVALSALPLSPNGKLDRKALPEPSFAGADQAVGREPGEGLESKIAAIFCELLGRESVGANEDFFAIGGHSLLAMRLAARIRRDLGRQIAVGQIMILPTVAKLAEHLLKGQLVGSMAQNGFDPVIHLREGSGTPLICVYPASGMSWQYSVLSRYLRSDMPIIGLQSPRPNGAIATSSSIDDLCDRQLEALRQVQPHGPYNLLGYSLGGTIAYGLARRLRQRGETVRFLGLLDTYPCEVHDWNDPEGAEANLGAEREQEQFINDAMADVVDEAFRREKEEMFGHIFENYRDSVSLLSKAKTGDYCGHVTLFVAERSLLPGLDPQAVWEPKVGSLAIHRLPNASHEDILSPTSLENLGPLLGRLIEDAASDEHPTLQAAE